MGYRQKNKYFKLANLQNVGTCYSHRNDILEGSCHYVYGNDTVLLPLDHGLLILIYTIPDTLPQINRKTWEACREKVSGDHKTAADGNMAAGFH